MVVFLARSEPLGTTEGKEKDRSPYHPFPKKEKKIPLSKLLGMIRGIDAVFVRDITPVGVRPHYAGRFVDYPLLPFRFPDPHFRLPARIAGMIADEFHRFIKMCVKHNPLSLFPPLPIEDRPVISRYGTGPLTTVVTSGLLRPGCCRCRR